jgi:putative phosphonate metabolism protein
MTSTAPFVRYALYWAPEDGDPLGAFGAAWLGHDPASADPVRYRERLGLSPAMAEDLTAEPRRYGLHATLKAPFRLKPDARLVHLADAVDALARSTKAFTTEPLRLTNLNGFLALCPAVPSSSLDALARRSVTKLDPLRAPLTLTERARRKPQHLTPEQLKLLDTWGYPHVLEHFRFHITLTKRLTEAERSVVRPLLETATKPFCSEPFPVGSIALFGDPGDGHPFRLVQRFPLAAVSAAA